MLSWPIGSLKPDGFFRKGLVRRVISLDNGTPESRFGFDDEVNPVHAPPMGLLIWFTVGIQHAM